MARRTRIGRRQSGVVLLVVLIFVLISSLAASSLVQMHKTQTKREREEQLLFVGEQFRKAVQSYYNSIPPNGVRAMPKSLEDLLVDNRFPTPLTHLRRIYPDPMTGNAEWGLVTADAPQSGIAGVYSLGTDAPLKSAGFPERYKDFKGKASYQDWRFVYKTQSPGR